MKIDPSIISYAIPPFISGLVVLSLGIFCYRNNPRSPINKYFSFFLFACAQWQIGFALMNIMADSRDAFFFSRFLYTGVIMIPVLYLGFTYHFLGLNNKLSILRFSYGVVAAFIITLWTTRLFLNGNIHYSWGFSSRAGIVHNVFLVFFCSLFAISIYELLRAYHRTRLKNVDTANRIKYVFVGECIALIASTDYLSAYGIDYYPLGFAFMISFAVITLYALVKHRLMDINIVLKKGFLYTLTFSLISFVLILITVVANSLSKTYFGFESIYITFVAALLSCVIFIPLHNYLIKRLNVFFFHASPMELLDHNTRLMAHAAHQDRLRAVATLAAGMAHEIKNPLTAIKTFADHFPAKYADPEFRQTFKRVVSNEVDRVNNIVQQLLDFSKPKDLELKPASVKDILEETLSLLNSSFLDHRTEVVRDYKANPELPVDRNQLKQAFLNLLLNAIQAMPNGGTLMVTTSLSGKEEFQVSIADTGVGIPEDQLGHIFDPFYTTKESGTGLGLSIVHGIVTRHGGKVKVASQIGQGTQFSIRLRRT